jgi:hypothetical protein
MSRKLTNLEHKIDLAMKMQDLPKMMDIIHGEVIARTEEAIRYARSVVRADNYSFEEGNDEHGYFERTIKGRFKTFGEAYTGGTQIGTDDMYTELKNALRKYKQEFKDHKSTKVRT